MSPSAQDTITLWTARHAIVVWVGILLNLVFIVPLLFDPEWLLGLFNLPLNQPIWARFAGLLLLIVSVNYIPATIDLERYRVNAWLAVFPSRAFGATFFFLAVFVFGAPAAFLLAILLDGTIGLASLYCLIRVTALEQAQSSLGEAA